MIRAERGGQRRVELRGGSSGAVRQDGTNRGSISLISGKRGSVTPGRSGAAAVLLRSAAGFVRSIFTRLRPRPVRGAERDSGELYGSGVETFGGVTRHAARDAAEVEPSATELLPGAVIHGGAPWLKKATLYAWLCAVVSPKPIRHASRDRGDVHAAPGSVVSPKPIRHAARTPLGRVLAALGVLISPQPVRHAARDAGNVMGANVELLDALLARGGAPTSRATVFSAGVVSVGGTCYGASGSSSAELSEDTPFYKSGSTLIVNRCDFTAEGDTVYIW